MRLETTTRGTSFLEHINALAPGKCVTVVNAKGEAHALPLADQAEAAEKPSELDLQIRSAMEVVASIAASLNEIVIRAEKVLSAVELAAETVESAAEAVKADQAQVAESIALLNATLAQPVKPIYNAKGILIGARRVLRLVE